MRLFRKSVFLKESGALHRFTDYHSHLLPGVEYKTTTLSKVLDVLSCYEEAGVDTVWLTPHITATKPLTTAWLRARFEELTSAYKGGVRLCLASENRLDALFAERLEQDDLLPLGDKGDRLLVDLSYFNPPEALYETLDRIKAKGYQPVLAHPERYSYMDKNDYRALKKMGVTFQLNLFALAGYYGKVEKKISRFLLDANAYDLIGTDVDSMVAWRYVETMRLSKRTLKRIEQMKR